MEKFISVKEAAKKLNFDRTSNLHDWNKRGIIKIVDKYLSEEEFEKARLYTLSYKPLDGKKRCVACGEISEISNFKDRRRVCKPCAYDHQHKIYLRHREKYNHNKKMKKYNMTNEEFDDMKLKQDNKCEICKNELGMPHIDHDHKTGKIRSLLCLNCNVGIGALKDDLSILKSAVKYLQKFEPEEEHDGSCAYFFGLKSNGV